MERMSPMVADSLAETRARSRLGMAMAAMIPMIATTIRSSIRVKPRSVRDEAIPLLLPDSALVVRLDSTCFTGDAERGTVVPLSVTRSLPENVAQTGGRGHA